MARLAMIDKVQDAVENHRRAEDEDREDQCRFRKEMSGDRPDPEKMKKMRDEVTDKLKEVLNADQQKRLMGIFVQVMGAGAVMDPAVGKEIDLTDEQKESCTSDGPTAGRSGRARRRRSIVSGSQGKMDKKSWLC